MNAILSVSTNWEKLSCDVLAIHEGVNRVVLAHTYVKTGMVNRATLTLDDIACFGVLTAKNLHSESFAFRLTAVLRTTDTFFMCHFFLLFN